MKKILITGGNGFLGSNLTRELYRLGFDVRVMVRPSADLKGIDDIPCEVFYGNIDEPEQVMQAVSGCTHVVHAASITGQWDISFEEYEQINFTGTKNIVEACLHYKTEKLIYVSTANTIGPGSRAQPGTELNGFTLFKASSGYINSKYLAQQYVLEQVQYRQLPAIVVNPTFMIGPFDTKPSSGQLLLYAAKKKILICPPGGKNFVHIEDVCKGIISALHNGRVGDCYLLAGQNLSYREFFRMVCRHAKHSATLIPVAGWILRLAGLIGSLKERITRKGSKLNNSTAFMLCLHNYYSGGKSERELKMRYTPVEEAISDALSWFQENKYI